MHTNACVDDTYSFAPGRSLCMLSCICALLGRTTEELVCMVLICVGCQLHHSADDPELPVHCDLPEGGVLLPCWCTHWHLLWGKFTLVFGLYKRPFIPQCISFSVFQNWRLKQPELAACSHYSANRHTVLPLLLYFLGWWRVYSESNTHPRPDTVPSHHQWRFTI